MKTLLIPLKSLFVFTLCFAFLVSCAKLEPDPVGTIILKMRNYDNGRTYLYPSGFNPSAYFIILADNNFSGYNIEFVSIGTVGGLGNVTSVPTSGWSYKVAVKPGHGYVARCTYDGEYVYARIYVVSWTEAASSGGIIGAEIKYQSPFYPK